MSYGDYDFSLAANAGLDLSVTGSEVFLRSSDGRLRVTLNTGQIVELGPNQGLELKDGNKFSSINIKDLSGAPNTGVIFIGDATFRDQTFTGTVTVLGGTVNVGNLPATAGAFSQTAPAVTNASGNLVAAKANRRYLYIQNKDGAGNLYVNLTGAAATVSNGIWIEPGGSHEVQGYVPTGPITAIGDIALNNNVVVVEG